MNKKNERLFFSTFNPKLPVSQNWPKYKNQALTCEIMLQVVTNIHKYIIIRKFMNYTHTHKIHLKSSVFPPLFYEQN